MMVTGYPPFNGDSEKEIKKNIMSYNYSFSRKFTLIKNNKLKN